MAVPYLGMEMKKRRGLTNLFTWISKFAVHSIVDGINVNEYDMDVFFFFSN